MPVRDILLPEIPCRVEVVGSQGLLPRPVAATEPLSGIMIHGILELHELQILEYPGLGLILRNDAARGVS